MTLEGLEARLNTHEAVCELLRRDMADFRKDMKEVMRGMWRLVLVAAGALIVGEAGLIITLALSLHGAKV